MPQNITDVDAFTSPATSPADGDNRNASSVLTPFQTLANRTRFLYNILTSTGVLKFRTVSGSVPLKALTGMADGDIAVISSVSTLGIYRFRLGSTLPADVARVGYNANDATGSWENVGVSSLIFLGGVSGTVVQWNPSSVAVPNRIVGVTTLAETSPANRDVVATGGWDDLSVTVSTPVALVIGDLVLVEADGSITNTSTATFAFARVASVDPSLAVAAVAGSKREANISTAGNFVPVHCAGTFVAAAAGFHDFKIQVQGPSGETIRMRADRFMRITIVRP